MCDLFVYARRLNLLLNNTKAYARTSTVNGIKNGCIEDVEQSELKEMLKLWL